MISDGERRGASRWWHAARRRTRPPRTGGAVVHGKLTQEPRDVGEPLLHRHLLDRVGREGELRLVEAICLERRAESLSLRTQSSSRVASRARRRQISRSRITFVHPSPGHPFEEDESLGLLVCVELRHARSLGGTTRHLGGRARSTLNPATICPLIRTISRSAINSPSLPAVTRMPAFGGAGELRSAALAAN